MTKKRLLLFITLMCTTYTFSQDFDLYALGGPVASQIDGDHFGGYNKVGLAFGLGVSHDINEEWSALMELGYIQKGKGTYNESNSTTYKIKLNYLQLPIAINYHIMEKVSVETGLSLSYLLSSKFYENGEPNDSHSLYTPYKYDIDWLIGGTYVLTEEWKINVRFSYSIVPMGDTLEGEDVYRSSGWRKPGGQYNNSVTVAAQYWF